MKNSSLLLAAFAWAATLGVSTALAQSSNMLGSSDPRIQRRVQPKPSGGCLEDKTCEPVQGARVQSQSAPAIAVGKDGKQDVPVPPGGTGGCAGTRGCSEQQLSPAAKPSVQKPGNSSFKGSSIREFDPSRIYPTAQLGCLLDLNCRDKGFFLNQTPRA